MAPSQDRVERRRWAATRTTPRRSNGQEFKGPRVPPTGTRRRSQPSARRNVRSFITPSATVARARGLVTRCDHTVNRYRRRRARRAVAPRWSAAEPARPAVRPASGCRSRALRPWRRSGASSLSPSEIGALFEDRIEATTESSSESSAASRAGRAGVRLDRVAGPRAERPPLRMSPDSAKTSLKSGTSNDGTRRALPVAGFMPMRSS